MNFHLIWIPVVYWWIELILGMVIVQTVVTTQDSNGLRDTDVVFRKLVGHNLRRSFTCFPTIVSWYGPNSSESAQYVLKKGTRRIFQYGLCRSIFFKSNESMEASCQALSKTRAESIRVLIYFLISPKYVAVRCCPTESIDEGDDSSWGKAQGTHW